MQQCRAGAQAASDVVQARPRRDNGRGGSSLVGAGSTVVGAVQVKAVRRAAGAFRLAPPLGCYQRRVPSTAGLALPSETCARRPLRPDKPTAPDQSDSPNRPRLPLVTASCTVQARALPRLSHLRSNPTNACRVGCSAGALAAASPCPAPRHREVACHHDISRVSGRTTMVGWAVWWGTCHLTAGERGSDLAVAACRSGSACFSRAVVRAVRGRSVWLARSLQGGFLQAWHGLHAGARMRCGSGACRAALP